MSYICSKCKKEYSEQVKFCSECGSPVEAAPAPESVPAPEVAPTPTETPVPTPEAAPAATSAPAPEAAPAVPAQKKTNVWGIIGGIIVVLGIVSESSAKICLNMQGGIKFLKGSKLRSKR